MRGTNLCGFRRLDFFFFRRNLIKFKSKIFYLLQAGGTGNVKGTDKHAGRILKMCLSNFSLVKCGSCKNNKTKKGRKDESLSCLYCGFAASFCNKT